jgi:PPK2 family polyphosphate:nucleotide phosphotransferase
MAGSIDTDPYRVVPGSPVTLAERESRVDGGLDKAAGRAGLVVLQQRLLELQDLLYAERKRSLLVVLQAMDAIGKDSTIRRSFGPLNPQRCRTHPFKRPTLDELRQDFLWRAHAVTPARGMIEIWNRSHYEDVLVPYVLGSLSAKDRRRRYAHINAFETLLADEGTTILKFYLHASKDYQRDRLRRRLALPEKRWKFDPADVVARGRWDDFMAAYEAALAACNQAHAPWYVVPAERRWYRDLVVVQTVVNRLEEMDPQIPEPDFDPDAVDLDAVDLDDPESGGD